MRNMHGIQKTREKGTSTACRKTPEKDTSPVCKFNVLFFVKSGIEGIGCKNATGAKRY